MIFTARLRRARTTESPRIAILALALLLACALPLAAQAKKSDRSQPVKVSARSADAMAKPNGTSHLKGDVVISQGTLKATGASATIYFDANSRVSRVVLTGSPAHLRQIDDNGNLVKGHANTIDYNVPEGIATLSGDAYIKQAGRGMASGDTLIYNTTSSTMTARSHGDNRVHLTFQPRQENAPTPATSASSTPPPATSTPAPAASSGGH
ncbi:MAG TPA: lipopolysaccharide transport periplasmic protein LptA [Oleiagrimonas sp.]|nr:lipopolysaccharide transport periplasmic protein LptA [Oleiagrimonas sp.]